MFGDTQMTCLCYISSRHLSIILAINKLFILSWKPLIICSHRSINTLLNNKLVTNYLFALNCWQNTWKLVLTSINQFFIIECILKKFIILRCNFWNNTWLISNKTANCILSIDSTTWVLNHRMTNGLSLIWTSSMRK